MKEVSGTLVRKEGRVPCSTGFQIIRQQNTLTILFRFANCEFMVWSVSFWKFELFTLGIMSFMKITRLPNADCQTCQVTSTQVARGVLLPVLPVSRSTMWRLWFFSCPQLTCCILLRKGESVQYRRGGIFCLSLLWPSHGDSSKVHGHHLRACLAIVCLHDTCYFWGQWFFFIVFLRTAGPPLKLNNS